MPRTLAQVSLLVSDYNEAIEFYVEKLGFTLLEDTSLTEAKRWVVVAPDGDVGARLLLARAASPEQESRIGNQTGGRVFLFMYTDDLDRDHAAFTAKGVQFVRAPSEGIFGRVAVFEDLYGNLWDLIERRALPEGRAGTIRLTVSKRYK